MYQNKATDKVYTQKNKKLFLKRRYSIALIVLIVLMFVFYHFYHKKYELDRAVPVIMTGEITDKGAEKGKPLFFYMSGTDIESIRFSCKNQYISFMDWTCERDMYGWSRNFTVEYGENEKRGEEDLYFYLLIDWYPKDMIEKVKHSEFGIKGLETADKEDMIVLQIKYLDGTEDTIAIFIELRNDGKVIANVRRYEIKKSDTFVFREDDEPLPEIMP